MKPKTNFHDVDIKVTELNVFYFGDTLLQTNSKRFVRFQLINVHIYRLRQAFCIISLQTLHCYRYFQYFIFYQLIFSNGSQSCAHYHATIILVYLKIYSQSVDNIFLILLKYCSLFIFR